MIFPSSFLKYQFWKFSEIHISWSHLLLQPEFIQTFDAICKILTGKLEILIGQKSRGIQVSTKTGNSDLHTLRPLKLLCLHIPPCSGHLLNLEALLDPQFWNHWDIWFQWSSVTSYYTRLNSNKIKIKTFHLNIHTNTQNHFKSGKMFVNFHILAKPFQTCYMNTKVDFWWYKNQS